MTSIRTEKNADDGIELNIEYNAIAQHCRQIEREKRRMVEHFRVSFCKCKKALNHAQSENKDLKLQQSLMNRTASRKRDEASINKLREFITVADKIMQSTEKERRKQLELDRQIRYYSERLDKLKKPGSLNYTEYLKACEKSRVIAENKLQKKNEKLGLLFASISKIRGEIDIMCADRRTFVEKWKQLLGEMAAISQEKSKLVQASLDIHDEREKIAKKIRFVLAKSEKDKDLFDTEIKERQRINSYINRLKVFITAKSKGRYKYIIMPKRDQSADKNLEANHLEDLEEAFNKLGDLLGSTEIEKIVEIFKSNECQINRAVEYINTQDSKYSKIKEEIDQLEEYKAQALDEIKATANCFREQILRLDETYTSVKAKTVLLARSLRRARMLAKRILQEVKFLKSIINFDADSETDLDFSALDSVTKTMMALEQRIGEIYDLYKALKNRSGDGVAVEDVPDTPTNLQTDSAISDDNATTDGIDDLPSVGETFDEISMDSGNVSQPISEVQLRKLML